MRWDFDEEVSREGTGCVKYDLRKQVFGTGDVLPMWVADMDFKTPDFIISAIEKRLKHEVMGYSFQPPEYFSSVSAWLRLRHEWKIEDEWVTFCPGVVPALNLCTLAFTRPGDSVIIQPPVYTPFFSAVENHGRNLILNQLKESDGKWTMDLDSLAASITPSTRMIIISNPHNPVGRSWKQDELTGLANICIKNDILLLSDEIHSDLVLPGYTHTPVAKLSEKIAEITVTCIAPSKTFNLAGLSTSSVIISNPVLRKYFKSKVDHLQIGNGNIFGTVASIAAYSEGFEWLDKLLEYLNRNTAFVVDYCRNFIPEIIPVKPEATYMIWLDCRKLGMTGKKLGEFFVKKALVGLNEGSSFGPGGEGFMRMNLATTNKKVIRAMESIRRAVETIR
ncbi:MAG TPA: cystathionine beta-lyase [Bacteroidales bacterium]|nr:cystathionine beta-lyase [Bacteroidales bacterium]HBZ22139.1 cystathionine beta-lyase [Bacteroidales bacterium]